MSMSALQGIKVHTDLKCFDAHHYVCHVSMCLSCLWLHAMRLTVCHVSMGLSCLRLHAMRLTVSRADSGGIQASSKVPRRAQQHGQHKVGFYQGGGQDPPSSGRSQTHVILTPPHRHLSYSNFLVVVVITPVIPASKCICHVTHSNSWA